MKLRKYNLTVQFILYPTPSVPYLCASLVNKAYYLQVMSPSGAKEDYSPKLKIGGWLSWSYNMKLKLQHKGLWDIVYGTT